MIIIIIRKLSGMPTMSLPTRDLIETYEAVRRIQHGVVAANPWMGASSGCGLNRSTRTAGYQHEKSPASGFYVASLVTTVKQQPSIL